MVLVVVKVLPPEKNASAAKLAAAEPPALIETLFCACAAVGMISTTTQSSMVSFTNDGNAGFFMDGSSLLFRVCPACPPPTSDAATAGWYRCGRPVERSAPHRRSRRR